MPWSNQSGGGGGGPWGSPPGGGPRGPWGGGPPPQGPQGGGPDLEDLLRRGQEGLRRILPPGGRIGAVGIAIGAVVLIGMWLASSLYTVQTNQIGVVLRFGEHHRSEGEGLRWHLPYPIEQVVIVPVTDIRRIEVGFRTIDDPRRSAPTRDIAEESLMLTGDENIVDIDFAVQWNVKNAEDYLFSIANPDTTIKEVAESAMREIIGRRSIQPILTGDRTAVEVEAQQLLQRTLDEYKAGVNIIRVQLAKADPPSQVIDAFRDVQAARADAERAQNEAQTYANRQVPDARGRAAQIIQAAEAYREQTVADARGQAARFLQVYEQYRRAPDVTRERIYLETMERVFGSVDKIIIDKPEGGTPGAGVVPFLSLNEFGRRAPATTGVQR